MKEKILRDKQWSIGVASLALASGLLTLWNLQTVARSEYYAAIARSMSTSFRNFFFGAIDPAGTVTLDKIPGSYWVPAIFARLFGFSTWAITAPNALATIGLVVVVAFTAKMIFGRTAGFFAAAIVATTPIVIAVSRSNQPQSFFLLTLSIAGYYGSKALLGSSRKYLIISGAWIAVAFHTYMLEAWALWPALIVAWFFTAGTFGKKILDLLIAGLTSLALSLTWIITVALIPASHRPYVGGTFHNNPFEMVFGYNGLGRFSATSSSLSSATDDPTFRSFTPPFGGKAGFGRIFSEAVAGQIAWIIPTAVAAIVILLILKVSKPIVIFFAIWLVTFFSMFSLVAGIHQFYTSSLSIPVAVISAGAIALAAKEAKHWHIIILLAIAGISAFYISSLYPGYVRWASYLQATVIVVAVVLLFLKDVKFGRYLISAFVIVGIVLTPAAWAIDVHNHTNSINPVAGNAGFGGRNGGAGSNSLPGGLRNAPNFPLSGKPPSGFNGMPPQGFPGMPPQGFNGMPPQGFNGMPPQGFNGMPPQSGGFTGTPPIGGKSAVGSPFGKADNSKMITYLKAHRNGAKFLLVTFGAQSAASYITATGENVMPVGGFDGQDPTPTLSAFKKLVASGQVRYVLTGGLGIKDDQAQTSTKISNWVSKNCSIDSKAPSTSLYLCQKK